jgi:hypothetical protein
MNEKVHEKTLFFKQSLNQTVKLFVNHLNLQQYIQGKFFCFSPCQVGVRSLYAFEQKWQNRLTDGYFKSFSKNHAES